MIEVRGVYEVAIRVRDLDRAERFYRDVLGLEVGLRLEERRWVFLRAGGAAGMVVLQEEPGEWPKQHFALTVDEAALGRAVEDFRRRGIATEGPVFHDWMPARSLYFEDPDGHQLELCVPLDSSRAAGDG